jgi:multidrug resistance protein MdtO
VIATIATQRPGSHRASWSGFLLKELAPAPDRLNATLRIVLTCVLVVVISMALEIPEMALSAYMVFFINREDPVTTALTGVMGIIGLSMAIALTIVAYLFTVDYGVLRVPLMACIFFAGMFFWRTLASAPAGFVLGWMIGFVFMATQVMVDLFQSPEAVVRAALWFWVAIGFPVVIMIAMNLLFLPADPERMLRRELSDRLRAVAAELMRLTKDDRGSPSAELGGYAEAGSPRLFKLLKLAEIHRAALRRQHAEFDALITLIDRLTTATATFGAMTPAAQFPALVTRLKAIAEDCALLSKTLADSGAPASSERTATLDALSSHSDGWLLHEIEQLTMAIALALQSGGAGKAAAAPVPRQRLLVTDAFTNPVYPRFALKVTFAVMFCYIAYTAVDWPGIHTCVITCAIVALTNTGATIHKATLRIVGCLVGGAIALVATVFVVPHLESITGLALLIAAVSLPAAWLATGSERLSYAGLQMAFAFFLCILQSYAPGTEITMVRDRLIGIVFGNATIALTFAYVWPERASVDMWKSVAAALRALARLVTIADRREAGVDADSEAHNLRLQIYEQLATARNLAEVAEFEPDSTTLAGRAKLEQMKRMIVSMHGAFLAALALRPLATDSTALQLNGAVAAALDCAAGNVGDSAELRRHMSAALLAVEHSEQGAYVVDDALPTSPPAEEIRLYRALVSNVDSILNGGRDERVV